MRALVYRFSPARWLAARHVPARLPRLAPALSGVRLESVPEPSPPTPDWVAVRVKLAGICGTDVAMLRGRTGTQLSPFVSFPAVPGHEIVGVATSGDLSGRRVVIDPFLGCVPRGLPACGACAGGRTALCERFADGGLPPGMLLGFCRGLPGGWSEEVAVHPTQLHAAPEGLDDRRAVLAEPLAVALHPLLAAPPAGQRVLVIGGGTIGLCVLAAMALRGWNCTTVCVARHVGQRAIADRLGAFCVPDVAAAERLVVEHGWGDVRSGLLGSAARIGGFDRVVDAVGSPLTVRAALRLTRAGGRVDLLGSPGEVSVDLTWLWAHELQVHGFCGYGAEPSAGGAHTIDLALRLLAEDRFHLDEVVTHTFGLQAYREALSAAFFHRRSGAIKVAFAPDMR